MDASPGFRIKKTLLSKAPAPAAGNVALICVVALVLLQWIVFTNPLGLGDLLPASRHQVFDQHQYWRLWTTIGVHADMGHWLSNFGFFIGLAYLLRGYFGWLAFPFLSLFLGGLINLIALATYGDGVTLIGASGVVYYMAAFWLVLYIGTDRCQNLSRRLANAFGFFLVLLVPQSLQPQVSYRTHFIGLVVGILAGIVFFAWKKESIRKAEVWSPVEPEPSFLPEPPYLLFLDEGDGWDDNHNDADTLEI